ncbi:MAG TPA: hypothetical protein VF834_22010 [Streptosporangiaceae bacterium]
MAAKTKRITRLTNPRLLAAALLAAAATAGMTSCARAAKLCTVRHHYAIVIFQNGAGNAGKTVVSRFRLNAWYGPASVRHWLIQDHIVLKAVTGYGPALVVKTYPVGDARGCSIDQVRERES